MGWIADLLKEIPSAARYKSELEAMEKKVITLEAENVNLRQEIQRRDDVIQKEKSHGTILEEVRVKLLQFLAKKSNSVKASDAARALNIGEQLTEYHLAEMVKLGLISDSYASGAPIEWRIGQNGRAYLVTHGLLT